MVLAVPTGNKLSDLSLSTQILKGSKVNSPCVFERIPTRMSDPESLS